MIPQLEWTARVWAFDLPIGAFPALLERVRGTPLRAAALVDGCDEKALGLRPSDGTWSVKEHVAHLDDMHDLDEQRLTEFLSGAPRLTPADMTNRRTAEANHAATPMPDIIARFARRREVLVARLETLSEQQVSATSLHPRLLRPMRLIDWLQFVADHDDHHLARARRALCISGSADCASHLSSRS